MQQKKQQQDVSMSMDAPTHANSNANDANASPSNDPALAFCEAILEWNATGVVFLQQGQHAQALACFEHGLNGFGICLQNIFLPQNSRNTSTSTTTAAAATIREVLKMTVFNSDNHNHIATTNAHAPTPTPSNPTIPEEEAPSAPQAAVDARPMEEEEDFMDTTQGHPVAPEPTPTVAAPSAAAAAAISFMGPLLQSVPVGQGARVAAAPTVPQPQAEPSNAAAASTQAKGQAAGSQPTNHPDEPAAAAAEQDDSPARVVLQDVTDVFFDVYQCALVFISPRGWCQSEEQQAHYVTACLTHAAAVLLYNAGLTLHQLAEQQHTYGSGGSSPSSNSRRAPRSLDSCLAHETYRMALYLLEENALRGVHVAPYFNLLLLALFNNLGNLNGQRFFDIQRVLLCQEKLLCVFLQTEFDVSSSQQQRDDYVFFYMQLLLSFTRTPLLAPAA
jgi:hypothetical protein